MHCRKLTQVTWTGDTKYILHIESKEAQNIHFNFFPFQGQLLKYIAGSG